MLRRVLLVLMVVSFMLGGTSFAAADDSINVKKPYALRFSCGFKAEANVMSMIHWGDEPVTTAMRAGTSVGFFINYRLSRLFSVQADAFLHYKNSLITQDVTKANHQYFGDELALYLMYHQPLKKYNGVFSFGVGPFTEFGFKSELRYNGKEFDVYEVNTETGMSTLQDSNVGFAFLVGYEFPCGLQINTSYKISVSNLLDVEDNSYALRPQTFSIGVAYRFGKKR